VTIHTLTIVGIVLVAWIIAWTFPSVRARQALLLAASYLFYSNWGLGFLSILIASSLLNFILGALLRRRLTSGALWLGVGLNVILLGFFKYLPPMAEAVWTTGWQLELARRIIMPVGMSFWTFQGLSYLIDIYLEEEGNPSLLEFCLYMAFWPTVLSGPVCRLPNMLPQFRKQPVLVWNDISEGLLRVIQGLFMKMYLAQLLASGWRAGEGVAAGFDRMKSGWGAVDVWLLGIGFGFQLFFDFAGYSLMVIGVARMFGIRITENFNRPFLSATPAMFWASWHMSLSFWIRDYVFKPLAISRRDPWWPYVCFVISMTVFGLWHGAKWTFTVFGIYHGLLLVAHRLGQITKPRIPIRPPRYLGTFLAWGATFLLVGLGFILFRANDLSQGLSMIGSALSPDMYRHFGMPRSFYLLTLTIASGYFLFQAGHSLALYWRARYRERMADDRIDSLWKLNLSNIPVTVGGLFDFLAATLWWWLAPAVVALTVFVCLAIYTQTATVSITPFIYTLF